MAKLWIIKKLGRWSRLNLPLLIREDMADSSIAEIWRESRRTKTVSFFAGREPAATFVACAQSERIDGILIRKIEEADREKQNHFAHILLKGDCLVNV